MKKIMLITVLALGFGSISFGAAATSADAQAVDSSCTQDAATAGCPSTDKVGTGLLKCLHAYKKTHADFKFSDSCKASMQKMHADHAAR